MLENIKKVSGLIEKSERIILTTHVVPDGDAIGSVMALSEFLKLKGKNPVIINHSETPFNLEFMDPGNTIRVFNENKEENINLIREADLIFILDTNDFKRTKSLETFIESSNAEKICIDHHTGLNTDLFSATISNTEYPSTCSILYEYMKEVDEKHLSKEVASSLYVGIMTDTGSFRYPRTTSYVFRVCADLIDRGAEPVSLYESIYATTSMENLKLMGKFIESFEFYFGNKVVTGIVTRKDFDDLGLGIQHVEGFTSLIMDIQGIKIGIVLVELPDNIKVSFRSKGDIDVSILAKEYGGGGHKNAAGANVRNATIEGLKSELLGKIKNYLD
ncbi:MAG: bifunctional oligoribonuclease/PAP phosphatase NrnA [Bacteroidetes bacterium]|nr:bifunctional oligoribonuclease/PAP phosphatase NrnA [Bacteroidota bacterium]